MPEALSDPRASLAVALRQAVGDKSDIFSTPYSIDFCRMVLEGRQLPDIHKRLSEAGVSTSQSAIKRVKALVMGLPPDLKARLEAAEPVIAEPDTSAIGVLKTTMASIAARIKAIEDELRKAKENKQDVSDKRDDQLIKFYAMYADLRKQLEREREKSEVVQAYRRAAADMCMLAMEYIPDDKQADFLEKVRDFERRNL